MRILQVMAGGKRGGAETAFVDMCLALHEAGETIEVVTRANDVRVPPLQKAGITVHTLPFGGKIDVFTTWRMAKIIKAFKPDIVQTWMSRGSSKVPPWRESMNIPRYLVVARLGGYYKLKYFKPVEYFIGITPDICRYLIEEGVLEDRVKQISNFAETEEVDVPIKRADYDTPADVPLLLGLGRLHPSKAFDTLIKVTAAIPQAYLWIAGEGPQRAELEALIKRLKVGERVKLLGWRSDRAALFQAVDICVFSSRFEPFGTVFVQSWAQKTPLVTTASDGPRQFVHDGEDGLVVPIDDIDAMREAIEKIMNNKRLAQRLVENGYARYSSEFTKEICLRNYLKHYHTIRSREEL
ncbi:MAG: glycosyltransferase [Alphaproteobacteria bacterium]|nr:glycosyltransferase [Alphaproteobacteria bacterium]